MFPNLLLLLILQQIIFPIKAIEYKLREAKPNPHRCAYYYKINNKNEEKQTEKWLLKPSAIACIDELNDIIIKEEEKEKEEKIEKNKKRKRQEEKFKQNNNYNIIKENQQKTLCQQIFGKKEGEEELLRSAACDNEWIQPLARKCRQTCGTCCELPEFQCEDKAHSENHQEKYRHIKHSTTFSCYTIKDINTKCKRNSVWFPTLADHCQSTCGLCEVEKKERKITQIEDDEMNEATKYDLKIPRTYECKDRRGEKYCLSKVLTKGNACKYKPRILDRCQKSCGICFPKRNKCQNKEGYERRCKRWDHNNFCLGKKFSLAIKLHYCPEQCNLCDREDDEKKDEKDDDYSNEDEEKGKKKWLN